MAMHSSQRHVGKRSGIGGVQEQRPRQHCFKVSPCCSPTQREQPNNSFKPNLLRYTKAVAEKACHGFGSTTQVGLNQALGPLSTNRDLWMHKIRFVTLVIALLAGCSSPANQIESFVGQRLKDSDSAKFSNIRWHHDPTFAMACGTVNAKNSYGAYEGPQDFIKYSGWGVRFEQPNDPIPLSDCCDVLLAFDTEKGGKVSDTPEFARTCEKLNLLNTLQ